ncbi:MAG: hypothetical protein QM749_15875 [Aquabacterium sp.]
MKAIKKLVFVAAAVAAPVASFAATTAPDFSQLTSGIDFSTVITALFAAATALVGVYLAVRGAKIVMSMIKSG